MNQEYWRRERDRINEELGNDKKPSIMEYFTIGIFDFTFKNGALNIGFIDYEYLVELIYKNNASYEFDLFVDRFQNELNKRLHDAFHRGTINEIKYIYDYSLREIIGNTGNQLSDLINDFEKYVEENNLLKSRNVVLLLPDIDIGTFIDNDDQSNKGAV